MLPGKENGRTTPEELASHHGLEELRKKRAEQQIDDWAGYRVNPEMGDRLNRAIQIKQQQRGELNSL